MTQSWQPQFLFVACQHGANGALKRDVARRFPECRPAFSRPGFVTFKLNEPVADLQGFDNLSPLARRTAFSLNHLQGDVASTLAERVWSDPRITEWITQNHVGGLHVWQRDECEPGRRGFEPGMTPLALEVHAALLRAAEKVAPAGVDVEQLARRECRRNRWVLDVSLVEPGEWWIGCHRATSRAACWPGGVPPIEAPEHAVSRAYLKMSEALWWSALPIARGEIVLELGAAPGGSAQALLDAGAAVTGVDPAEIDSAVLEHPLFTHVRRRTTQLPRKLIKDAHWLVADMNVAPRYTLDAVEDVVRHPEPAIRGMLLTCKLSSWDAFDHVDVWVKRIKDWGYHDVRIRQLAFNRQEICIAALRSRAQRRVVRMSLADRLARCSASVRPMRPRPPVMT